MIRTTRPVTECECLNCGIIYLLGQKFNGQNCCARPKPKIIGERMIVEYKKTNEEERAEALAEMNRP